MFEVPIRLSLFDVLKLFDLLLFMCGIMVLRIIFLDLYKTSWTCFLIYDVNTTSIYFYFEK